MVHSARNAGLQSSTLPCRHYCRLNSTCYAKMLHGIRTRSPGRTSGASPSSNNDCGQQAIAQTCAVCAPSSQRLDRH